jgi:hypothetical protein
MDPNPFSRDRLLLSCESNQISFWSKTTKSAAAKEPKSATTEFDRGKGGIPAGYPKSIASPTAWSGADFEEGEKCGRCSLILDETEIEELEEACRKFKGKLDVEPVYCFPSFTRL